MPNSSSATCRTIDPLVTPYVDGQLADGDRLLVDRHLRACPPCYSRVAAERAVRDLIHARKSALASPCASSDLRAKCADAARLRSTAFRSGASTSTMSDRLTAWRARFAPLAVAASLVMIVGAAFLYQLTTSSTRVMAAELAADHVKCFALNGVLHTHEAASTVESSMSSWFGWQMHLPERAAAAGLELVGARPCIYGAGKIAHIMYRLHGEPVSLFMLPKTSWSPERVQVMGHTAAVWCDNDRTFVLIAREPNDEVERVAAVVRASLR
jgi:anti-sigma factor RsiW